MIFKSKKDWFFSSIIFGISSLIIGFVCYRIYLGNLHSYDYWGLTIALLAVGLLLLWPFLGTKYMLSNNTFIYRSGLFSGKIDIKRIIEIEKRKTLWVGFKPATARGGLIIKYEKYNEIYISPETNETFINCILAIKSDIIIKAGT